jgi:hypothetical protein
MVDTNLAHDLGCFLHSRSVAVNTGVTTERWIGDEIRVGDVLGRAGHAKVVAPVAGLLQSLIRAGSSIWKGPKIGGIDLGGDRGYHEVLEKASSIGGSVPEAVLAGYA